MTGCWTSLHRAVREVGIPLCRPFLQNRRCTDQTLLCISTTLESVTTDYTALFLLHMLTLSLGLALSKMLATVVLSSALGVDVLPGRNHSGMQSKQWEVVQIEVEHTPKGASAPYCLRRLCGQKFSIPGLRNCRDIGEAILSMGTSEDSFFLSRTQAGQ